MDDVVHMLRHERDEVISKAEKLCLAANSMSEARAIDIDKARKAYEDTVKGITERYQPQFDAVLGEIDDLRKQNKNLITALKALGGYTDENRFPNKPNIGVSASAKSHGNTEFTAIRDSILEYITDCPREYSEILAKVTTLVKGTSLDTSATAGGVIGQLIQKKKIYQDAVTRAYHVSESPEKSNQERIKGLVLKAMPTQNEPISEFQLRVQLSEGRKLVPITDVRTALQELEEAGLIKNLGPLFRKSKHVFYQRSK